MTATPRKQPIPFGKYLLLDRIQVGGMAEVWRGKSFEPAGDRLVAVKRILPSIAEDLDFVRMFVDEAKISVQLAHTNIAQVLDFGLERNYDSYFIAMEYIGGRDLRAVWERCRKLGVPPNLPLVCYVISKMCEGLDYAHRKLDPKTGEPMNIVHRDISPQNLLISFEGEVKVIDFGIAKAAGKATRTQAGTLKGKFAYMSPEQLQGAELDGRSDLFSVGICLFELLTGERLFTGETDFAVLEKVRKVDVPPPSRINPAIPDALEAVVHKALAKDPAARYQHGNELARELQRFLITSEGTFGRKDLAQFMKATFAEDLEKERERLAEYAQVKPPPGFVPVPTSPVTSASGKKPMIPEAQDMRTDEVRIPAEMARGPDSIPSANARPKSPQVAPPVAALPTLKGRSPSSSSLPAASPPSGSQRKVDRPPANFDAEATVQGAVEGLGELKAAVPNLFEDLPPTRAGVGSVMDEPSKTVAELGPRDTQPERLPMAAPAQELRQEQPTVSARGLRVSSISPAPRPPPELPRPLITPLRAKLFVALGLLSFIASVGVVIFGTEQGRVRVSVPVELQAKTHVRINQLDYDSFRPNGFVASPGFVRVEVFAPGHPPFGTQVFLWPKGQAEVRPPWKPHSP